MKFLTVLDACGPFWSYFIVISLNDVCWLEISQAVARWLYKHTQNPLDSPKKCYFSSQHSNISLKLQVSQHTEAQRKQHYQKLSSIFYYKLNIIKINALVINKICSGLKFNCNKYYRYSHLMKPLLNWKEWVCIRKKWISVSFFSPSPYKEIDIIPLDTFQENEAFIGTWNFLFFSFFFSFLWK